MRSSPTTPTDLTRQKTQNDCQTFQYRPLAIISSWRIASAARRISRLAWVIGADDADAEARAGERLAPDDLLGQAERAADPAHLVLEELRQRLEQLELMRGQAADIVVALDQGRRVVADGDALDDVRIERALREVVGVADLAQRLLEDLDEGPRR